MPSRAKTTMKRKSRNSKLMMDFMELSRDSTRFLREAQYLVKTERKGMGGGGVQGEFIKSVK